MDKKDVIYNSSTRKEGILPLATTRMDPEHVVLSKVSQTERDKYRMISLMYGI